MKVQKTPIALAAITLFSAASVQAAPSVSWRAPAAGATITQSIDATSACEVGGSGIRRVEFAMRPYEGGSWVALNIDQDSPWRCVLDVSRFKAGKYTLRALAYDRDSGGTYTKATRTINIGSSTSTPSTGTPSTGTPSTETPSTGTPTTGAPTVSITAPTSGATVKGSEVVCAASASDSNGIKSVQFLIDGALVKTDTTLPHSCKFDSTRLRDGTHTLRAIATDNKGLKTTTEVSFTVQNGATTGGGTTNTAPSVSLTAPASGATLSGTSAAYAADASDTGGSVAKVDFYLVPVGGTPGTPVATRTAAPYSGTLNTTTLANGSYNLMAVATDNQSASATTQRSVTISNTVSEPKPQDPPPSENPGAGTTLPANGSARAVPTFESLGMYWKPGSNPGAAGCSLRYRKFSESAWREALPMWYDTRDGECRGSIVHLEPGTDYAVEMGVGTNFSAGVNIKTWSENFPIAKTIQVQSGSAQLTITEGGTPQGYVLYTGPATLDGANTADYSVNIKASYVIVRGLTLKGAKVDGITISPAVTNVVIEDNDISGWGRPSGLTVNDVVQGKDRDSGVRANCVNTPGSLQRVIIQRNRIHDPRYGANSWDGKKHPLGPVGIEISHCGGNNVIRYNEITSKDGHYFKDGMGGQENFSKLGFSSADNDIYGNIVTHAWDDGIEAEGGGRNTRIWGNYIDQTAVGIATTGVAVGPMYIFRNVQNRSRHYLYISSLDADDRMTFSKTGSPSGWGDGRRYIFHNTLLQASQAGLQSGMGAGEGISGLSNAPLTNTVSRNNILHVWKAGALSVFSAGGSNNDLDYDLVNGNVNAGAGAEANRIVGTPLYRSGHGWASWAGGNYQLDPSSPGYNRGARIPNFNDAFTGSAPDTGAHEGDTPTMRLGIEGGLQSSAGSGDSSGGGTASGGSTDGTGGDTMACAKTICVPLD